MPLPLIIGAIAGAATTLGVGAGIYGASKIKEAKDTEEVAKEISEKAIKLYKDKESELTALLDPLGKKELKVIKSFTEVLNIKEKISGIPDFNEHIKANGISNIEIPKLNDLNLKDLSIWADTALASLSGAAAGVAGGFAAAGSITTLVTAFGTASTGTAISTLSGAALTNAVWACLGGGSLVIGGGGMALGTSVLGVASGGIGFLIGGAVLALMGSNKSDEADEKLASAKEQEKEFDKFVHYCDELIAVGSQFNASFCALKKLYEEQLRRLDYVVNVLEKVHWSDFVDSEKQLTENTMVLAELLYEMCNISLVLKRKNNDGFNPVKKNETGCFEEIFAEVYDILSFQKKKNNDGFNPVNKDGVEFIINKASKILEKFHM